MIRRETTHLHTIEYYAIFLLSLVYIFAYTINFPHRHGYSLSTVMISVDSKNDGSNTKQILFSGKKIKFDIKSQLPNLGTILVRFDTRNRINQDTLIFRLKEQGSGSWYYENTYKADQFQPQSLFPFGFPQIANSEYRSYQIELESINGTPENSVAISDILPNIYTQYDLTSSLIRNNPKLIVVLIFNQLSRLLTNSQFILELFMYSLPLLSLVFCWQNRYSRLSTYMVYFFCLLVSLPRLSATHLVSIVSTIAITLFCAFFIIAIKKIIDYNKPL